MNHFKNYKYWYICEYVSIFVDCMFHFNDMSTRLGIVNACGLWIMFMFKSVFFLEDGIIKHEWFYLSLGPIEYKWFLNIYLTHRLSP